MSGLATPEKIQELQRKLGEKAKRDSGYRFYSLYDKVHRRDILSFAYALVKANGGAAGVDGKRFKDIEDHGVEQYLDELQKELQERRYRPEAVRRVMIPKPNGGERPLGIPTIKDRTVQAAAKLVLEPIFEADFTSNAHGYRPDHSAGQAAEEVLALMRQGHTDIVDADLTKYFDTIPHAELMSSVARRVSDGSMLELINMWLKAPVEERDEEGRKHRRPPSNKGTPQGGVLSPLLANIYMRRFLKTWGDRGYEAKYGRIVNYADDFVMLCRGTACQALSVARDILTRIGLTLNEAKTRVCEAWRESFNFLGFTFGKQYSRKTGRPYLGMQPSDRAIAKVKEEVRTLTTRGTHRLPADHIAARLNARITGWANYFRRGSWHTAFRAVERHVFMRYSRWLARKHKRRGWGSHRFPAEDIYGKYGLVHLL